MGSSSSASSRQAQRAEDQRRRGIEQTQQRIEGIFGSPEREADIQSFIDSARGYQQDSLDRSKKTNDRQLKFAMARGGTAGGSVDVDLNQNLSEDFLKASVEGERRAQGAGAQLRASDQEAKFSLFNQALGGLDMTTATNNAAQSMRNNIDFSKNVQNESNFDNFFSDYGDLFTASRKSAGERRNSREFGTDYAPRPKQQLRVAGAAYGPPQ